MALVLANRVQETSTTTGTGTLTLAGAVLGYQTFAAGIGTGNTCYYAITSTTGAWEVGIGTVGTGTLARTTLLSSSTGSLVSFTGTLNVYVTYPSEKSVNLDASNVITNYPITVKDNVFTLQDDADPTKQAQFQLSGLTTGTTFTYTLPAVTSVLATTSAQSFAGQQTFANATNFFGSSAGASTTNVGSGATTTGLTKTVNLGTGGLSGSTTAIAVGSANGSTTTMLGTTVIGGAAGNQSLQVNNVASAVNYAQLVGAVTGSGPIISAQGSDANINLAFLTKGTGGHTFSTGGGQQFTISHTASAVDYLQATGNSGGFPSLSAQGASTNVSIVYGTKGTGTHNFTTGGLSFNQFVIAHTASAVNQLTITGSTTGAPIIIQAQGSDTNVNLAYAPKGTGRHTFYSNSGTQFVVGNTASAVNYAQTDGAATNAAPTLSAQGSDANINLKLTPKGTGGVQFTGPLLPNNLAGTSGQVLTSAGAGAVPTWTTPAGSNITAQGLYENANTISANYTIGTGNNAVSAGPITINSGIVVTVPSGSTWVIV